MDYTKWDTIENWKLTNRGEKEVGFPTVFPEWAATDSAG